MECAGQPYYPYGCRCARCERVLLPDDLHWNSIQHHGARELLCKDRKACERIRRKLRRKH